MSKVAENGNKKVRKVKPSSDFLKEKKVTKIETKVVSAEEILNSAAPMKRERKGRPYTVSVALPASIVANAQSHELRSYLVGQIARACTVIFHPTQSYFQMTTI